MKRDIRKPGFSFFIISFFIGSTSSNLTHKFILPAKKLIVFIKSERMKTVLAFKSHKNLFMIIFQLLFDIMKK